MTSCTIVAHKVHLVSSSRYQIFLCRWPKGGIVYVLLQKVYSTLPTLGVTCVNQCHQPILSSTRGYASTTRLERQWAYGDHDVVRIVFL
jgi:hypothetical protein